MKKLNLTVRLMLLLSLFCVSHSIQGQSVRILPLGNSITYDSNVADKTNPRATGDRISYRYKLYQLINEAGCDFDFVGSEYSGGNYLGSEYDDNAGFPGIETDQLARLITDSYNERESRYEASGPYLNAYPADIILLHIGTNNVESTASNVSTLLDNIRFYSPESIIFVAKIINRKTYNATTTTFNNNVEAMVNARNDNRIVMVDMENGAGLVYSSDMADDLHPNLSGYEKIGAKWWEAIYAFNEAPVIGAIPPQPANEGEAFADIDLDDFVQDAEDADWALNWTVIQENNSVLTASVDVNNVLSVSAPSLNWIGSETLCLKVTDTGDGAFPKSDSVEVLYSREDIDLPPTILSQAFAIDVIETTTFEVLKSHINYSDPDTDDSNISLEVSGGTNYTFVGNTITADNDFIGTLYVNIRVKDQTSYSNSFALQIEVIENPNEPPVIESLPLTQADDYETYSYSVQAEDPDADAISYFAKQLPSWAEFTPSVHRIEGIPKWFDADSFHNVSLGATDGIDTVFQNYSVYVGNNNDAPEFSSTPDTIATYNAVYIYHIEVFDADENDNLSIAVLNAPSWLSLNGDYLSGQPTVDDYNSRDKVTLTVTDGRKYVEQSYFLNVSGPSSGLKHIVGNKFDIFPNPANETIFFKLNESLQTGVVTIWNQIGQTMLSEEIVDLGDINQVDVSQLNTGVYYITIQSDNKILSSKFIIQ